MDGAMKGLSAAASGSSKFYSSSWGVLVSSWCRGRAHRAERDVAPCRARVAPPRGAAARAARGDAAQKGHGDGADADAACFGGAAWVGTRTLPLFADRMPRARCLDPRPQRIAMVTAYDYPSAVHVELAGIHVLLCGDSVGMVRGGARRANTSQTDGFVRRAFSRRLSWATTRRSP